MCWGGERQLPPRSVTPKQQFFPPAHPFSAPAGWGGEGKVWRGSRADMFTKYTPDHRNDAVQQNRIMSLFFLVVTSASSHSCRSLHYQVWIWTDHAADVSVARLKGFRTSDSSTAANSSHEDSVPSSDSAGVGSGREGRGNLPTSGWGPFGMGGKALHPSRRAPRASLPCPQAHG